MLCVVKINFLILLTVTLCYASLEKECPPRWFDCGNGKCISDIWRCDDDNDCGNLEDERNCDERLNITCLSSQFSCESDQHCIPERWHCDGESDCEDGSDEQHCDNSTTDCVGGFLCQDHRCIPMKWYCDGHKDCSDGSDEVCTTAILCADDEFLCSSGSCLNRSLVCDGRNDCSDGSDEGIYCGDSCANASCSQKCDSTPAGPLCYCDAGYNLDTKDNETCVDIDECLEEGFCSHACSNVPGSYTCSCLDGYELVNRTCRAKGADPLLIFSTLEEIRGMRLRSGQYFLVRKAVRRSAAVDADPGSERVYWVEISNTSSVYSAKVDGTGFRTVLSHGLLVPEDIAVDYVARNLYLTDSGLKQVLVCKMDGTVCSVLHDKNIDKPRSLALHFAEGFLYWSDWGDKTAGIYRSGMDGSARIHLVSRSTEWPNGIAIDHTVNRLYWADAKLNTIECIFLDGSTRRVISSGTVFHPYSLAVFEDTLYWTDWSTFSLESCNKFTGHKTTLMTRENGEHIMGVHVYHPVLAERVINPCWSNDCSHMCLIAPSHGFRCACPPGFNLSVDNRTCTMKDFSPSVFVSEGSSVFYMRPESVGSEAIRELPLSLGEIVISKVSYDPKSRTLFVADLKAPAIHEVNMTSLQIRELVKNNVVSPDDMAFDWMSNNLYWVDSSKGTVEVISADGLKRVVLIEDIPGPIALAISQTGHMFVASVARPSISMYGMDGKDKRILYSEESFPMSLAVHPTRTLLYWADPRAGTISFVDYITQRAPRVVMNRIPGIMSVAVNEDYLYWTVSKRELHLRKDNSTFLIRLPGQDKGTVSRKVTYTPVRTASGTSVCLLANGGCSFLCLSSPTGRTCACPAGVKLANDNVTCEEDLCSPNDFRCKNGRCILKSFRCDRRDDCADNSDEEDCPEAGVCEKGQMSCGDGECIPTLWRCDGELDCTDSSDEIDCNETRCDSESHVRCDTGQCIPTLWVCDGSNDCLDGSDEKNCGEKQRNCSLLEYRCEEDGRCIDEVLKCDGRPDCSDGSDERDCRNSTADCRSGMYRCQNGKCIYDYEVCDGHSNCDEGEEELNCTRECDEFFCNSTAECLPWSRVCDGCQDCEDLPDEGGMCRSSCSTGNGGCAQICRKSPQGPNCACYSGYRLLSDEKTCDDIDECLEPRTCSHFCNNTKGGFKCSCAEGYSLHHDHRSCRAEGGPATLVYLLEDEIRGIDLPSHTQKVYMQVKDAEMKGMDYDASERIFYWTNWPDGSINSYSLDTHKQDVITRSSSRYIYVRYDWIAGNLYYTDDDANIGVCSKDGKCCKSLIQFEYGTDVASLDISPTAGLMFWTRSMRNLYSGVIERAEMNGSNRFALVSDGTIWPAVVTVEHVLQMIYWTDVKLNILECADFQGLHRRQIATREMFYPFSLAVFEDHVYWTDWGTGSIIRCHKFNSTGCSKIHDGNVRPQILMVVHEAMQPKGEKQRNCSLLEYRCEEDGRCIDEVLKCDGRADCSDGSDERDCRKIYGDNAQAEKLVHSQDLTEWKQKMDILSKHSRKSRGNLPRKKQKKKHMRKSILRQNKRRPI